MARCAVRGARTRKFLMAEAKVETKKEEYSNEETQDEYYP
jgi:hypothetical protein